MHKTSLQTLVLGQQFNVVLLIDRPNRSTFRDVLFRAYVSSTGFPVHLDLYGEELARCADETALEDRILEFFRRPETKSRLQALQEFAAGS